MPSSSSAPGPTRRERERIRQPERETHTERERRLDVRAPSFHASGRFDRPTDIRGRRLTDSTPRRGGARRGVSRGNETNLRRAHSGVTGRGRGRDPSIGKTTSRAGFARGRGKFTKYLCRTIAIGVHTHARYTYCLSMLKYKRVRRIV